MKPVSLFSLFLLFGAFTMSTMGQQFLTEHTIAGDTVTSSMSLDEFTFLAGLWQGDGLGGIVEEQWSPPQAGAMIGTFRLMKEGKNIDNYYVIKALQLYIEGVSLREIERLIGVSHVSVMNWVKKFNLKAPENNDYHPTYKVMRHDELISFMSNRENTKNTGMIITELGDKYMLIKWEKLKGKK
jgi:hypothetical protein